MSSSNTEVEVTVTTTRTDDPDGLREATVSGSFETALRSALAERCEEWALTQVWSGVLSRRQALGKPVLYVGEFKKTRTITVGVRPTCGEGRIKPAKVIRLPDLYVPADVVRQAAA